MDTMDGFLQYLYLKEKTSILTYTEQYRLSHISLKHFYLSHLSIEQNIRICCCNKELLTNAWITLSISTNIFLRFHRNIPINKIINVSLCLCLSELSLKCCLNVAYYMEGLSYRDMLYFAYLSLCLRVGLFVSYSYSLPIQCTQMGETFRSLFVQINKSVRNAALTE